MPKCRRAIHSAVISVVDIVDVEIDGVEFVGAPVSAVLHFVVQNDTLSLLFDAESKALRKHAYSNILKILPPKK